MLLSTLCMCTFIVGLCMCLYISMHCVVAFCHLYVQNTLVLVEISKSQKKLHLISSLNIQCALFVLILHMAMNPYTFKLKKKNA